MTSSSFPVREMKGRFNITSLGNSNAFTMPLLNPRPNKRYPSKKNTIFIYLCSCSLCYTVSDITFFNKNIIKNSIRLAYVFFYEDIVLYSLHNVWNLPTALSLYRPPVNKYFPSFSYYHLLPAALLYILQCISYFFLLYPNNPLCTKITVLVSVFNSPNYSCTFIFSVSHQSQYTYF